MHQVSGFYLYRGTLSILSKYLVDFASVGISELGSVFRNLQPLISQCIFKKFIKLTVVRSLLIRGPGDIGCLKKRVLKNPRRELIEFLNTNSFSAIFEIQIRFQTIELRSFFN